MSKIVSTGEGRIGGITWTSLPCTFQPRKLQCRGNTNSSFPVSLLSVLASVSVLLPLDRATERY